MIKRTPPNQSFKRRKSNKSYCYCGKLGHVISECFKLKNKREKEEDNSHSHPHEPIKATFVESDSDCDVLFGTDITKGSVSDWTLDSGCTTICIVIRTGF